MSNGNILIMDRKGEFHLSNFALPGGNKYTLCHRVYLTKEIITTLAIDQSIDLVCEECRFFDGWENIGGNNPRSNDNIGISLRMTVFTRGQRNIAPSARFGSMPQRRKKFNSYLRKTKHVYL
jgi:hypothetical protein